jgi:hypothetical protein
MLGRHIRYHQEISRLNDTLKAMPEYPIYCEADRRYVMYVNGRCRRFANLSAARLSQLQARASWLRAHGEEGGHQNV